VGGALGAGDHGAVQCSGRAGPGVELAGHGARVRPELEERGDDRETAVQYGLKHRARPPVHVIGIDEVSRRKAKFISRWFTIWNAGYCCGSETTGPKRRCGRSFTKEMGARRCHTLRVVCMDMWAPYAKLVREHATNAQILFDRFHIVKHLHEAVEEVRRSEMRRLSVKERVVFKRSRWLLLKNPWNLTGDQKERLSTMVRWNTPIVRAYYLKESFQLFWDYRQPGRANPT